MIKIRNSFYFFIISLNKLVINQLKRLQNKSLDLQQFELYFILELSNSKKDLIKIRKNFL
jgi:hypothetical protein